MERPADGDGGGEALLFSLQFFVGSVSLTLASAAPSNALRSLPTDAKSALLVGFQLLQYEIVLFELREPTAGSLLVLEHGKSCLFEAEPAALADQLREESDSPLVLLLMAQERDRARLVAFASVELPLHVGLAAKEDLPTNMKYRVCEWARGSGEWELRNHQGDAIGKATGAVTLSCLGKSLAPHLKNALGVHVGCAPSASPIQPTPTTSVDLGSSDSMNKRQQQGISAASVEKGGKLKEGVLEGSPKRTNAKTDSAVQCKEVVVTNEALQGGRQRSSGAIRLIGSGPERQRTSVSAQSRGSDRDAGRGPYPTLNQRSSPRRRVYNEDFDQSTHQPKPRTAATAGGILSSRGLPPPLFFQKQPASRMR